MYTLRKGVRFFAPFCHNIITIWEDTAQHLKGKLDSTLVKDTCPIEHCRYRSNAIWCKLKPQYTIPRGYFFSYIQHMNEFIGVRDQFRLGGQWSVARIFYPLLARISSGFARIFYPLLARISSGFARILYDFFFFCPNMAI